MSIIGINWNENLLVHSHLESIGIFSNITGHPCQIVPNKKVIIIQMRKFYTLDIKKNHLSVIWIQCCLWIINSIDRDSKKYCIMLLMLWVEHLNLFYKISNWLLVDSILARQVFDNSINWLVNFFIMLWIRCGMTHNDGRLTSLSLCHTDNDRQRTRKDAKLCIAFAVKTDKNWCNFSRII